MLVSARPATPVIARQRRELTGRPPFADTGGVDEAARELLADADEQLGHGAENGLPLRCHRTTPGKSRPGDPNFAIITP
ncbi:hypothetical protein BLA60_12345 [Actinophytocola xinjiangensis]|uniref:Uncharacterized protein n=1 Tax=Actinophytocola xinjiangensis TaxID=485602 RepID=A0A7Z0WNJ6_9PSEU|nr:hypothetical protein [Actinophytocola xinjiangensis]OLF11707.1 hypothetical protein BLA60_12345 [Actinophytocola xinjiangensis]